MKASIIICTYNRSESLRQTLASLARVHVPRHLPCELIVVDNGSSDPTEKAVQTCLLPHMPVRYLREPRRGKSHAYNAGVAAANGEVLLFTDDDVQLPANWVEGMCTPILSGRAHAVAGAVRIAPQLQRPWMEQLHRWWLASTDGLDAEAPGHVVGANMAFSKEVFQKVPRFDPELGPGALGFEDEGLFQQQVRAASYRLVGAFDVVVEHHFDEARLSRSSFLDIAKKAARSQAYVAYHWKHETIPFPRIRLAADRLRLAKWRVQKWRDRPPEGLPLWEVNLVFAIAYCKQYLIERKRPRLYEKYGLVKRTGA